MLVSLDIKNVVLIEHLHLDFTDGLTVFTGETGAGKSILLDSLSLALGQRADTSLIRAGEDFLSVSAIFSLSQDNPALELLTSNGIDVDDELIVRRILNKSGKSRFFINDEPVNASFLKEISSFLLEIHGQFSTIGLLNESCHIDILDNFAHIASDKQNVCKLFSEWKEQEKELASMQEKISAAAKEKDYIAYVTEELERLNPIPGEVSELEEKRSLMQHAEKTAQSLQSALHFLSSPEGALKSLTSALHDIEKILQYLPNNEVFKETFSCLDAAVIEATEADNKLSSFELNFDANELNTVEERLFALKDLARKHKVLPEELPDFLKNIKGRLQLLDEAEDSIGTLEKKVSDARDRFLHAASALSRKRKDAAKELDKRINRELPFLKLDKAVFKTAIDTDETYAYSKGIDKVVFTTTTNKGSDFGSLSKIASGGELSRFMLALKIVLADSSFPVTLVFDEIDSGISGSVSAAVGSRLRLLSGFTQVLIVTHSPQIAAVADNHFFVFKQTGDKTNTHIVKLTLEDRMDKIAEMLSGAEITPEAKAAAKILLEEKK